MTEHSKPPRHPDNVLFGLGRVVATPGALRQFVRHQVDPFTLLCRHITNDWGECDTEDMKANDQAVIHGTRILSVYCLEHQEPGSSEEALPAHRFAVPARGLIVWCITEADRSVTTFLLPSEY